MDGELDESVAASRAARAIYVFANEKGGMVGIDQDKINAIILELSKNSAYTRRQLKQDVKVDGRITHILKQLGSLTDAARRAIAARVEHRTRELERTRQLDRVCVVVDFDMFYAAVEIRDKPELATLPVAVGGIGMISTANYVARRWGVRSAMPGFVGVQLCRRGPEFGMPAAELVFVPPNFEKYTAVAAVARAIFREYDPSMRAHSLDEAYLDISAYVRARARHGTHEAAVLHARGGAAADGSGADGAASDGAGDDADDAAADADADGGRGRGEAAGEAAGAAARARLLEVAEQVVDELRARVRDATGGLTCSAGIGPNFLLAKVCADQRKPDGQFCVGASRGAILSFLAQLPARKIGGIGRVMEKVLHGALGVRTCGELLERAVDIHAVLSPNAADSLLRAALGWAAPKGDDDDADAAADGADGAREPPRQKGISCEQTFRATALGAQHEAMLDTLCARLADEMRQLCGGAGARGRTVTLKLKSDAFDVSTRDSTGAPVASAAELRARAGALLARETALAQQQGRALRLRLMGVRVTRLERADGGDDGKAAAGQLTLEAAFTRAQASRGVRARDASGCDGEGCDGEGGAGDDGDDDDDDDDDGDSDGDGDGDGGDGDGDGGDDDDGASDGGASGRVRAHSDAEDAEDEECAKQEDDGDWAEPARSCARSPPAAPARPPAAPARSPAAPAHPPAAPPRRLSKYARLEPSEVDPLVLSELPPHLRAEIGAEIEHECARRRSAATMPSQLDRGAPEPPPKIPAPPRGARGAPPLRSPKRPAARRGRGIEFFLAAGPRTPGCEEAPSAARLQAVRAIVSMGFDEAAAAAALSASRGDVQRALERLLE